MPYDNDMIPRGERNNWPVEFMSAQWEAIPGKLITMRGETWAKIEPKFTGRVEGVEVRFKVTKSTQVNHGGEITYLVEAVEDRFSRL